MWNGRTRRHELHSVSRERCERTSFVLIIVVFFDVLVGLREMHGRNLKVVALIV